MNNLNKLLILLVLMPICGNVRANYLLGISTGRAATQHETEGWKRKYYQAHEQLAKCKARTDQCKARVESLQKTLENELDTIEWVEE